MYCMGKVLVATSWNVESVLVETETGEYKFFKIVNNNKNNPIKITTEEALDIVTNLKLKGDAYDDIMERFGHIYWKKTLGKI